MSTLTPRPSHRQPATEADEMEPGLLPVEPDLGPVPVISPDEPDDEVVIDTKV